MVDLDGLPSSEKLGGCRCTIAVQHPLKALWVSFQDLDVLIEQLSPVWAAVLLELSERDQQDLGCSAQLTLITLTIVLHQLDIEGFDPFDRGLEVWRHRVIGLA